jgi:hypothetical protein
MGFTKTTSIIDKTFATQNSSNYQLSINFGMDCFNYAIIDTTRNKFIVFEAYEIKNCFNYTQLIEQFTGIIKSNAKLSLQYENVLVSVQHSQSTQIPKPLYDLKTLPDYLKFHRIMQAGEVAEANYLSALDAYNAYAIAFPIKAIVSKHFTNAKIVHYSSPLLQNLLSITKNNIESNCYLQIQKSSFDIIIINKGKLQLYNSYKYSSNEDLLYFLLYTFEQLKLNPETIEVTLLAEFDKNSEAYELLYKYVKNINFIKRSTAFEYSFEFNDIPEHYYYNLLSQLSCEL